MRQGRRAKIPTGLLVLIIGSIMSCALPAKPTDRYAVVIGITRYQFSGDNLVYPDQDAIAMKALLFATGWTDVTMLTNESATRAKIESSIRALGAKAGSNSSVLVYYSGHGYGNIPGIATGAPAWMIPYDGVSTGGSFQQSNWIDPASMNSWLNAIPSANRLLILDSCYSGGFVDTAASVDTAPQNYGPYDGGSEAGLLPTVFGNAASLLTKALGDVGDPNILTISAAGTLEQSYDGEYTTGGIANGHGAFTYFLLQAASDSAADTDGNKLVTAIEAYSYAKNKIKSTWNAKYWAYTDGGMHMDFLPHISGGSGDIVLYDKR